jgi:hypothetical protein
MFANNDYPVLDGIAPSWADIILKVAAPGAPVLESKHFKSINTGRTVEVGEQRAGGRVMKRTTGSGKSEASATLYREGAQILWRVLVASAKAQGYVRGNQVIIGMVHFGLQIQHTPPGSVEIFCRRLKGCRVLTDALNGAEGTEADVVDLGLNPIEIADVIDGEEVVLL